MTSAGKKSKKRAAPTELLEYTLEDVFGEGGPSFTSQSISADTRRTHEKSYHLDLPSPMKRQRTTVYFADVGDEFEYTFEDLAARPPVPASEVPKKARAKRYLSSVSFTLRLRSKRY
jgi:hypothetical protein